MKNVLLAHEPVGFAWVDCCNIQQRKLVRLPLYTSLCTISVKPLIIRVGNRTLHQPISTVYMSHHLIVFIKAFSFNSNKPKSSRFEVTHNPRSCSTIGCIPTQSIASMHKIVGLATIIAVARIWTLHSLRAIDLACIYGILYDLFTQYCYASTHSATRLFISFIMCQIYTPRLPNNPIQFCFFLKTILILLN